MSNCTWCLLSASYFAGRSLLLSCATFKRAPATTSTLAVKIPPSTHLENPRQGPPSSHVLRNQ
eukprot:2592-Eustigmatos_ZCMA.PRE.1